MRAVLLATALAAVLLVLAGPTAARAEPEYGGTQCAECQAAVSAVQALLQEGDTEEQVLQIFEKVCTLLGPEYRQTCDNVIGNLTSGLIRLVLLGEGAEVLCTRLRSCLVCCLTDTQPEQLHLALTADPTAMVAVWVTLDAVSAPQCQYGVASAPAAVNLSLTAAAAVSTYTAGSWNGTIYTAQLTGLEPYANHSYRCGDAAGGGWSDVYYFVPNRGNLPRDQSTRMLVVGDMGASVYSDDSVNRMTDEVVRRNDVDLLLHVGDIAYADDEARTGSGEEEFTFVWDIFGRKVQPIAARIAYLVSQGNHDTAYNASSFRSRYRMPVASAQLPFYWSMDYGYAHLLAYSAEQNVSRGSPTWQFIADDLAAVDRSRTPWVVMMAHRPLYCSNVGDDYYDCHVMGSRFRADLEQLVHQHGVDLFIQAHEHSFERSYPVYNGTRQSTSYHNANGTVYVVNGSAGCPERLDHAWQSPPPAWSAARFSAYGYSIMDINATAIEWQFVEDWSGTVVDRFVLTKS